MWLSNARKALNKTFSILVIFCLASFGCSKEEKEINGITFNIKRVYDDMHIHKHIKFKDKGKVFHYTERVQGLKFDDFQSLLSPFFIIENVYGSLDLQPFVLEKSDRLIIIATRKNGL